MNKYTEQECLEMTMSHSGIYGLTIIYIGSTKFQEFYITDEDDHNDIKTTGLVFQELSITISPKSAPGEKCHIVHLKMTNLPFHHPHVMKEGLQKSLQIYGEILDVGIFKEARTKVYIGINYAVLDVHQESSVPNQLVRN